MPSLDSEIVAQQVAGILERLERAEQQIADCELYIRMLRQRIDELEGRAQPVTMARGGWR